MTEVNEEYFQESQIRDFVGSQVWRVIVNVLADRATAKSTDNDMLDPIRDPTQIARNQGAIQELLFVIDLPKALIAEAIKGDREGEEGIDMPLGDEINEVIEGFGPSATGDTLGDIVETPVETPVEPPIEPAPVVELAPVEEPQPVVEPVAPPPVVEIPPVDDRDSTIEALRAEIARLAGGPAVPSPVAPDTQQQMSVPVAPQPVPQPIEQPPQKMEFVATEEDLDKLLNTKDDFNAFMSGVVQKAVAMGQEQMLRTVPSLVMTLADQQINLRSAIREFYENNKDLIPHKSFVGYVANEIAAKDPGLDLQGLVGKLGTEVRNRLRLKVAAESPAPVGDGQPQAGAPGFPPSPGSARRGRGSSESLTKLEKEILDIL